MDNNEVKNDKQEDKNKGNVQQNWEELYKQAMSNIVKAQDQVDSFIKTAKEANESVDNNEEKKVK